MKVKPARHVPKRVAEALRDMMGDESETPLHRRLLNRLLPLPSPMELGRSEYNALPSNIFDDITDEDPEPDRYTWEDWEAEMRRDHPVAWFLRREVPKPFRTAFRRVKRPIDDAIYWVQCHTLPSYRFHILDLRNPGGGEKWSYGWRDRTNILLWANFKILTDFVELEQPFDIVTYAATLTPEKIEQEGIARQVEIHREMMDLYHWWKTGREAALKQLDTFPDNSDPDKAARRKARDAWHELRRKLDADDQTNLLRLVAIREYLWT